MWIAFLICLLILFIISTATLSYLLYIQLIKIKTYDNMLNENNNWILKLQEEIRSTYLKMKILDNRNIFVKDDEVGVVFQELLNLLKKLNDRVDSGNSSNNG